MLNKISAGSRAPADLDLIYLQTMIDTARVECRESIKNFL